MSHFKASYKEKIQDFGLQVTHMVVLRDRTHLDQVTQVVPADINATAPISKRQLLISCETAAESNVFTTEQELFLTGEFCSVMGLGIPSGTALFGLWVTSAVCQRGPFSGKPCNIFITIAETYSKTSRG